MKGVLLAVVALLMAFQSRAATPPTPLTPDCRYLFIVDTSLSMARLQEGVNNAMYRMVATGLGGQMVPGEVFTIWTFNEEVQQREFPLNSWSEELNQLMGNRVIQFLQNQRYRRNANMRALINAIIQAKQTCPRLAVFLISNGQEVLVGTPFDRNINVSYGRRFEELRAARVPFLTTLLCQNGTFVGWSVSAANEPVTLPRGQDGEFVVGREKQKSVTLPPPAPTVVKTATNTPPVNTSPATVTPPRTSATMTVKPRSSAMNPVTNTVAKVVPPAKPKAKPIPVQPVPRPNKRPTIDLTRKVKKPDEKAPRVVKPTEVAPDNRVKLTSASFTKTNTVLKGKTLSNPVETNLNITAVGKTNRTAVAKKPATNVVKVATAPKASTNIVEAAMPAPKKKPEVKKPEVKKPEPKKVVSKPVEVAKPAPKPKAGEPKPESKPVVEPTEVVRMVDAVTNDNTKVVTRFIYVTQVVNVAMPGFRKHSDMAAKKTPEPVEENVQKAPVEPRKVPSEMKAEVADDGQPVGQSQPSFVATPKAATSLREQPFAVAPNAPKPVADPATAMGVVGGGRDYTRWILLAVGVLLIVLAALTAVRVFDRPVGATYISQSMGSRDNGSRSNAASE